MRTMNSCQCTRNSFCARSRSHSLSLCHIFGYIWHPRGHLSPSQPGRTHFYTHLCTPTHTHTSAHTHYNTNIINAGRPDARCNCGASVYDYD